MTPKTANKKRGRPAETDFDELIDQKFGPFVFVRSLGYAPGKRRVKSHVRCELACKYGHPVVVEWRTLCIWQANPDRKRHCPKCGQAQPGVPVSVQLLLARVQKRIRHLSEERKRFFFTLIKERLPLAAKFSDDTCLDSIISDCLAYAETENMDFDKEMAELRAPIPSSRLENSQTGYVMKFNMPE